MIAGCTCEVGAEAEEREQLLEALRKVFPQTGRRSFGFQRTDTHKHQGIDLGAPRGTPVMSLIDGVVTHASDELAEGFSGYGRHVVVREGEDGPWFLFAHLESVDVVPGQRVSFAETLGTIGDSCFDKSDPSNVCKGVHLHFEVSPTRYPQGSEAPRIDPIEWIADERMRLIKDPAKLRQRQRKVKAVPLRSGAGGGGFALVVPLALGLIASFVWSRR